MLHCLQAGSRFLPPTCHRLILVLETECVCSEVKDESWFPSLGMIEDTTPTVKACQSCHTTGGSFLRVGVLTPVSISHPPLALNKPAWLKTLLLYCDPFKGGCSDMFGGW